MHIAIAVALSFNLGLFQISLPHLLPTTAFNLLHCTAHSCPTCSFCKDWAGLCVGTTFCHAFCRFRCFAPLASSTIQYNKIDLNRPTILLTFDTPQNLCWYTINVQGSAPAWSTVCNWTLRESQPHNKGKCVVHIAIAVALSFNLGLFQISLPHLPPTTAFNLLHCTAHSCPTCSFCKDWAGLCVGTTFCHAFCRFGCFAPLASSSVEHNKIDLNRPTILLTFNTPQNLC